MGVPQKVRDPQTKWISWWFPSKTRQNRSHVVAKKEGPQPSQEILPHEASSVAQARNSGVPSFGAGFGHADVKGHKLEATRKKGKYMLRIPKS